MGKKSYRVPPRSGTERVIAASVRIFQRVAFAALLGAGAMPLSAMQLPVNPASAPTGQGGDTANSIRPAFVPGQVIVKYKDSVTLSVREAVRKNIKFKDITLDRSDSLDKLHRTFAVRKARPVFRTEQEEDSIPGPKTLGAIKKFHEQKFKEARNKFALQDTAAPTNTNSDIPNVANTYVLDVSATDNIASVVAALKSDPHVEYAQPNYIAHAQFLPNDPYYSSSKTWGQSTYDLWNLRLIQMRSAWDLSQGAGVIVAVVDTGVDAYHPDIAGNIVPGWNFVDNTSDTMDNFGHGTHVAGTIAALGNNGLGIIGVAPQARIMPLKGLDDMGSGTSENLSAALQYAAQNGARVINNSWGYDVRTPSDPVIEDAVAVAHALGAVVVFAAGNSADDIAYYSPQNMPQSISVAASTPRDKPNFFSNFGSDLDVSAPGGGAAKQPRDDADPNFQNILSLKSSNCFVFLCFPLFLVDDSYLRLAGTSMAAPHVSGLAALILAQHPEYTNEQVRQVMRISSNDIGPRGFDAPTGYGRINAYAALTAKTPLAALITQPAGIVSGTAQVAVRGIASGPGFAGWTLAYGIGAAPSKWKIIATSTTSTPVNQDGLLTNWDISNIPDGAYTLRLTARSNSDMMTYVDRQPIVNDQVVIAPQGGQAVEGGRLFRGDITFTGTAAPSGFIGYRLRVRNSQGVLLSNPNISLTSGGTQKIYNGVLGTWNTAGVPPDNYRVELVAHVARATIVESTETFIYDPTVQ